MTCSFSRLHNTKYVHHSVIEHNISVQAKETSAVQRDQLNHYIMFRSHLVPLVNTASLTLEVLRQSTPQQTTVVSFTRLQHCLMSALRGADEPDGGRGVREEGEVLGSLAAALQATAEVLTTVTGEEVEREEREGKWRAGIIQELMVEAVRDMAWLVSSHNMCAKKTVLCV